MKVWIFVEGESDRLALMALWSDWSEKLRHSGWGIRVVPLDDKWRFFRKIGAHTVEKLLADPRDVVVGLPDYYPNQPYVGTEYQHATLNDLLDLQRKLVCDLLIRKGCDTNSLLHRFYPSALKHDLEMLLLAACDQLRVHLDTADSLGKWRHPVEEENQNRPPKRIVESLYLTRKNRAYRDTKDAVAVLSKAKNLQQLLYSQSGQLECPVFKEMLDWIAAKTGVSY